MVFADDSGLEIDVLGGQPGVRSARFADDQDFEPGMGAKDERNNRCVLSLLHNLEKDSRTRNRRAQFVCTLALARDGEVLLRAEGSVEGEIIDRKRGTNGFGYDPLFLVPEFGLTAAELAPDQKWSISHRGRAFRNLLGQLKTLV